MGNRKMKAITLTGPVVVRLGTGQVSVSHCAYDGEPYTHVLFQDTGNMHEVGLGTEQAGELVSPDDGDVVIHCANAESAQVVIGAFTKIRDALKEAPYVTTQR